MLSQKCLFVCPLLKFGEDICFPRNVNLPSLFLNLGKKSASPEMFICLPCFEIWGRFMLPKNVSLPSLFSNLGKKCFSRNVCLSALGNCLPCFWIWGRNMLPQICEFAFPVFEFGEEICFPRNMSLPSLFLGLATSPYESSTVSPSSVCPLSVLCHKSSHTSHH